MSRMKNGKAEGTVQTLFAEKSQREADVIDRFSVWRDFWSYRKCKVWVGGGGSYPIIERAAQMKCNVNATDDLQR